MATTNERAGDGPCARCEWLKRLRAGNVVETFSYMFGALVFDVSAAQLFVLDGRDVVEVTRESLESIMSIRVIDRDHVSHVDASEPGIIAQIRLAKDGACGSILIDGGHRASQCLRDGLPFYAYLLTERESFELAQDNTGLHLLIAPCDTAEARPDMPAQQGAGRT